MKQSELSEELYKIIHFKVDYEAANECERICLEYMKKAWEDGNKHQVDEYGEGITFTGHETFEEFIQQLNQLKQ